MADKTCALCDMAAIALRNAILYGAAALPLSKWGDIKQRITLSPCES